MKVPLILRDIETRTEDPQEREAVREIIEAEEHSLSKSFFILRILWNVLLRGSTNFS